MNKIRRTGRDEIQISFTELEFIFLNEMLYSIADHGDTMTDARTMDLHEAFVRLLEGTVIRDKNEIYESLYYYNDILRTIIHYNHFANELSSLTHKFNDSPDFNWPIRINNQISI